MAATTPHFVLFAEGEDRGASGRWRFVLVSTGGGPQLSAADLEPGVQGERLELLAVVRGLEALEQPSRVTIVTASRFIRQGLQRGLAEWREHDWCWERFGELVPVNHHDLWQRVDQTLKFHQVDCRTWRFDAPHQKPAGPIQRPAGNPRRPDEEPGSSRAAMQAGRPAAVRRSRRSKPASWGQRFRTLGERLLTRSATLAKG